MRLHAIAVELDLSHPTFTQRRMVPQLGKTRLDEAGIFGRLGTGQHAGVEARRRAMREERRPEALCIVVGFAIAEGEVLRRFQRLSKPWRVERRFPPQGVDRCPGRRRVAVQNFDDLASSAGEP